MERKNKLTPILVSFSLVVLLLVANITSVYAWFNGQGYIGKTMSYNRTIYIGSVDSNVTNHYGYTDIYNNFVYEEIDPQVGFTENNLIPGSFVHIMTDIENESQQNDMIISLYLQNVVYDSPLNDYLYFGTNDPIIAKGIYKTSAVYDSQTDQYTLRSVPLLTAYTIEAGQTLSLYWYIYIDSDAGMEIANTYISLGTTTVVYN
ncbi:MAG: hypothetical protein AB7S44_01750 [Spirochaetales bacterium]